MPWVRIDENALNHAKLLALSAYSFRLWVEGLAYCQRHLTDGVITHTALRTFRYAQGKHVAELATSIDGMAPLWQPTENGYAVHDYLQWNESREHVMAARAKARERIRKLRGKSGNGSSNAVTPREQSENEQSSFSGGVVCSLVSPGSSEKEGGLGETVEMRAGAFVRWYQDKHRSVFGVGYIGNPQADYQRALQLVGEFSDADLRDAAMVWFGMEDDFATSGTRTIPKFASRATKCVTLARKVAS